MAERQRPKELLERLPQVRGRYDAQAPIARYTWFRAGGPAEVLYRPADVTDLANFLAGKPGDVAVTVLGVGSNMLVRDGGIPGVVIRLGRPFSTIRVDGTQIHAGAMALDYNIAKAARDASIAGFEFLAGIPGTIGGGLRMNAGAYGREFKDIVIQVLALTPQGDIESLSPEDWTPRYRGCGVPTDWIFTGCAMTGAWGNSADIFRAMELIQEAREDTQPIRTRTGGSTYKNPNGQKAWELIERAGCRGLRLGNAQVSEKHCNFLVNLGGATAADIEGLGEEVRRRVREATGVELEWELERIGVPTGATS
ncbi:MAG: UDP-N-acetylmuramate dehydrogenase [Alphaproteobacteria bacterium]|nr:UDP-N-acetylmuramate dehydrogenase [Alphaproteobacteria bacterium]MCZ6840196.1 UDP-N-acetylmuramate dehydrogenase [Alphaproteobacteria bacterium]